MLDNSVMLLRLWALSVPRVTAFGFALTLPLARRPSSFSAFGMAETAVRYAVFEVDVMFLNCYLDAGPTGCKRNRAAITDSGSRHA